MILRTLLVSKDDPAAEALIKVLAQFGVVVDRSNAVDVAQTRLAEEQFDQVIVDFDDPETASRLLEACRRLGECGHNPPVTAVLLSDARQIRSILGGGAHFILTKPVGLEAAQNTFRAAMALLKHERRQSKRVCVQAEVSIRAGDSGASEDDLVEGILLDLSGGGMDVLTAKPLHSPARVQVSFALPGGSAAIHAEAEVAWSAAGGQIGLRFVAVEANMRQQLDQWLAAHSQETLPEEACPLQPCELTDVSVGGCYVRTESPFPQSSAVDVSLTVADLEVLTEGVVRVMHPGHGMGIEFLACTAEQRKSVGDFIERLSSQPGATPRLEVFPRSLIASAADLGPAGNSRNENDDLACDDPLLQLLHAGSALEEEAFLAELQLQRNTGSVAQ